MPRGDVSDAVVARRDLHLVERSRGSTGRKEQRDNAGLGQRYGLPGMLSMDGEGVESIASVADFLSGSLSLPHVL